MDQELLKGSIDILILSLLSRQNMYGYEIAKKLKQESNDLYQMSEGILYPALKRLEGKDHLESYWQDTAEGKRRKYYTITAKGQISYHQKLEQWQKINYLISKVSREGYV